MSRRTSRASIFAAAAFALVLAGPAFALPETARERETPAAAALARLAALTGEWEGTFKWTGGRTDRGAMNVRYFTTGYGSAVVETLSTDGVAAMTTVYHADGPDLRMTHYCGARNQPRLKASKIDLAGGALDFAFVDATNLSAPDAPHVTGLEVRFGDADHLTLIFGFEGAGKFSRERISLHRVSSKA